MIKYILLLILMTASVKSDAQCSIVSIDTSLAVSMKLITVKYSTNFTPADSITSITLTTFDVSGRYTTIGYADVGTSYPKPLLNGVMFVNAYQLWLFQKKPLTIYLCVVKKYRTQVCKLVYTFTVPKFY